MFKWNNENKYLKHLMDFAIHLDNLKIKWLNEIIEKKCLKHLVDFAVHLDN